MTAKLGQKLFHDQSEHKHISTKKVPLTESKFQELLDTSEKYITGKKKIETVNRIIKIVEDYDDLVAKISTQSQVFISQKQIPPLLKLKEATQEMAQAKKQIEMLQNLLEKHETLSIEDIQASEENQNLALEKISEASQKLIEAQKMESLVSKPKISSSTPQPKTITEQSLGTTDSRMQKKIALEPPKKGSMDQPKSAFITAKPVSSLTVKTSISSPQPIIAKVREPLTLQPKVSPENVQKKSPEQKKGLADYLSEDFWKLSKDQREEILRKEGLEIKLVPQKEPVKDLTDEQICKLSLDEMKEYLKELGLDYPNRTKNLDAKWEQFMKLRKILKEDNAQKYISINHEYWDKSLLLDLKVGEPRCISKDHWSEYERDSEVL